MNDVTRLDDARATFNERKEWIAGVRAMVAWLEEHPDVPLPYGDSFTHFPQGDKRADYQLVARAAPRAEKSASAGGFSLRVPFGPIAYEVWTADREEFCRKVQTGTKEVTEEVEVEPATTRKITKVVPTYEWECAPILGEAPTPVA